MENDIHHYVHICVEIAFDVYRAPLVLYRQCHFSTVVYNGQNIHWLCRLPFIFFPLLLASVRKCKTRRNKKIVICNHIAKCQNIPVDL